MLEVYYLSLAFQAVYHTSATGAGVKLLPLILVQVATLMASSRIIPLLGRFKWVIVAGPCFLALASGLLYSVKYGTSINHLYGYQVIMGIGIGLAMQNSMLAVQFELKAEPWLISAGTGLAVFIGFMGRIVGISLAGSVFENTIQKNLLKYAPGLPAEATLAVINSAAAVWTAVPDNLRPQVLMAYTQSLRDVYICGLPFSIIALGAALCIKNSKMQTKAEETAAIQASREKEALAKAKANGEDVVAADGVTSEKAQVITDAQSAQREEATAHTLGGVAPVPTAAVEGGPDAQVVLDQQQGKSAV